MLVVGVAIVQRRAELLRPKDRLPGAGGILRESGEQPLAKRAHTVARLGDHDRGRRRRSHGLLRRVARRRFCRDWLRQHVVDPRERVLVSVQRRDSRLQLKLSRPVWTMLMLRSCVGRNRIAA